MRSVVVWAILIGLAVAGFVAAFAAVGFDPSMRGGDAWNYLAAGERLNAGHALYAVGPGDRDVVIVPPYWTVPLLAPPPIAVIWRPLAVLGEPAMVLWGIANLVTSVGAIAYLLVRGALVTTASVALLAGPLGLLALSGNVNGFLLAALVVAWRFRSNPFVVGPVVAAAISLKVTPAILLLWLISSKRWKALGIAAIAIAVIGGASLIGAGVEAHFEWLRSVPNSAPSPNALASLTGWPPFAVFTAFALLVLIVARAGDERTTFAVALVGTALATPALYFQALGLAAAASAPWIRSRELTMPWRARSMPEPLPDEATTLRIDSLVR
jgi:hypothetical protein